MVSRNSSSGGGSSRSSSLVVRRTRGSIRGNSRKEAHNSSNENKDSNSTDDTKEHQVTIISATISVGTEESLATSLSDVNERHATSNTSEDETATEEKKSHESTEHNEEKLDLILVGQHTVETRDTEKNNVHTKASHGSRTPSKENTSNNKIHGAKEGNKISHARRKTRELGIHEENSAHSQRAESHDDGETHLHKIHTKTNSESIYAHQRSPTVKLKLGRRNHRSYRSCADKNVPQGSRNSHS